MSLYGGISFKGKDAAAIIPSETVETGTASPSASDTPAASTPAPGALAEKADEKPKSSWSSALRFAPTIRKKPVPSTTSAFNKSAFASAEDPSGPINQGKRLVGPSKPALSTPPVVSISASFVPLPVPTSSSNPTASTSTSSASTAPTPRMGRVLKPPPMTLDEDDVNGFKATTAGQKAAKKKSNNNNKKGKKGAGGMGHDPGLAYTEILYDPSRPCDYAGYKAHLITVRERKRAEREAERRKRERSHSGSSYTGSPDEDDEDRSENDDRRSKKARFFAPPSSYNETPADTPPIVDERPNPSSAPKGETGEEAYARRLAMSQGGGGGPPRPPPPQPQPQYQQPPAPLPTSFVPAAAQSIGPAFIPSSNTSFVAPPYESPTPPSSTFTPPQPPPNFMPPPFLPPPTSTEASTSNGHGGNGDESSAFAMNDAAAKAREIAQRLSRLAGMQPPPPAPPVSAPIPETVAEPSEPDNRPFAERMMAKFGYTEGKGLGASESGMTSALSVSRPSPHASSKKGGGKKKDEGLPPSASSSSGMANASKSRGQIIDSTREQRLRDQTEQFGEPSRVVLLTNLCGVEDVDDELSGEVAEEANKLGVVERCFVHLVPGEMRSEEAVRIFLVMSGLAGGYNAVKQFDGRFFGGRVVKARFYNEGAFNQGYHTL